METRRYPLLAGACAVFLVTGCAQTGPQSGLQASRVEPVYRVQQPVGTAAGQHAIGRIDLSERRYEAAIKRFRAALRLDPTLVEAYNGLGVAYGQTGRFAEAAEAFRAALASGPAQAYLLSNLGFAQLKAGQFDDAWESLRRSHDLDPLNVKTRENLALLAEARRLAAQRNVAPPVAAAATSSVVSPELARVAAQSPASVEPAPIVASSPVEFEPAPIAASEPVELAPAPIVESEPARIEAAPVVASLPSEVEPAPMAASEPVPAEPAPVAAAEPVPAEPAAATVSASVEDAASTLAPVASAPALVEQPVVTAATASASDAAPASAAEPVVAAAPKVETAPPAAALVAVAQAKAAKALGETPNPAAYEIVVSRSGDSELVQLSANVYELRSNAVAIAAPVRASVDVPRPAPEVAVAPVRTYRVEARVATLPDVPAIRPVTFAPQAEARVLTPPPRQSLKQVAGLEVSNAVGLRSLAGRTARQLERFGASVARVSDFRVFGKGRTEVHYLAGHLDGAKAVQQRLPVDARLLQVSKMHPGVNVRLVVGRDMVVGPIAWWSSDVETADSVTMARAAQVAPPPSIGIVPSPADPLVIAAPPGVDLKAFADKVARVDVEDGWRHL